MINIFKELTQNMFKELKENTFKELQENMVLMSVKIGNLVKEMTTIKKEQDEKSRTKSTLTNEKSTEWA